MLRNAGTKAVWSCHLVTNFPWQITPIPLKMHFLQENNQSVQTLNFPTTSCFIQRKENQARELFGSVTKNSIILAHRKHCFGTSGSGAVRSLLWEQILSNFTSEINIYSKYSAFQSLPALKCLKNLKRFSHWFCTSITFDCFGSPGNDNYCTYQSIYHNYFPYQSIYHNYCPSQPLYLLPLWSPKQPNMGVQNFCKYKMGFVDGSFS